MFNSEDFKKIINETSQLLDKIAHVDEGDIEEIQMRIDSNIQALRIMGNQIEDLELKERAQDIIKSISTKLPIGNVDNIVIKLRNRNSKEDRSDLIDTELYKSAKELKEMAVNFNKILDSDKNILNRVVDKMSKNTHGGKSNMNKLISKNPTISSSTFFLIAIIMFIIMYFFIKLY